MNTPEEKIQGPKAKAASGKNLGILTLAMFAAGIFMMAWGGYEIKGSYESGAWPEI